MANKSAFKARKIWFTVKAGQHKASYAEVTPVAPFSSGTSQF
jgi:hypothetical protein